MRIGLLLNVIGICLLVAGWISLLFFMFSRNFSLFVFQLICFSMAIGFFISNILVLKSADKTGSNKLNKEEE